MPVLAQTYVQEIANGNVPAETAPETAGRIVGETVLNILREKRA